MKKLTLIAILFLCSCSVSNTNSTTHNSTTHNSTSNNSITNTTESELWIMAWNGDGKIYKDIGHTNISADELTTSSVAMIYAVAKSYNENVDDSVAINLASYQYEGDSKAEGGLTWSQKRENFKATYGKYPDIYMSTSLFDDATLGLTADLSLYAEDEAFKSLNNIFVESMNYFGLQAGIPQYAVPAGVFVNRELAIENRINVPTPNWTWEEYTDFVSNPTVIEAANEERYAGSMNAAMDIIRSAYITPQLTKDNWSVDFSSLALREFVKSLPKQALASAYGNNMVGTRWVWEPFRDGELLTTTYEPWMLQSAGATGTNAIASSDWDIYPRPAFNYKHTDGRTENVPNHVSAVVDPIAIYNHCKNDGNPTCSDSEREKIDQAWDVLKYWVTDTRSWEARKNQQYVSSETVTGEKSYKSALSESLPVTTGDLFEEQLEIWFSDPNISVLKDEQKFPGFQEVLKLWREGKIYGGTDRTRPLFYTEEGSSEKFDILDVLSNYANVDAVGVGLQDANWSDSFYMYLAGRNQQAVNARYAKAHNIMRNTLKTIYGWPDNELPTEI